MSYIFFKLSFTDKLLESTTLETNKHFSEYLQNNKGRLKEHSGFKKWPENGISNYKMTLFIALTFYFGIVGKDFLCHYWSVDSVMSTPSPRSIMSRQEFFNMSFLHCCDSSDYPGRGQPGYNPRKKIGKVFTILQEKFQAAWTLQCHILIDEGTVLFKGNIHFKVFNPMKPDKYGTKTYKVCDSTNTYCLVFDLSVRQTDIAPTVSKYGKTHNLVISLLERYTEKCYIVYMDNYYSSLYLFYNLLFKDRPACDAICIPRKGLPTIFALQSSRNKVTIVLWHTVTN